MYQGISACLEPAYIAATRYHGQAAPTGHCQGMLPYPVVNVSCMCYTLRCRCRWGSNTRLAEVQHRGGAFAAGKAGGQLSVHQHCADR